MEPFRSSLDSFFNQVKEKLMDERHELIHNLSILTDSRHYISRRLIDFAKSFCLAFPKESISDSFKLGLIEKEVKVNNIFNNSFVAEHLFCTRLY